MIFVMVCLSNFPVHLSSSLVIIGAKLFTSNYNNLLNNANFLHIQGSYRSASEVKKKKKKFVIEVSSRLFSLQSALFFSIQTFHMQLFSPNDKNFVLILAPTVPHKGHCGFIVCLPPSPHHTYSSLFINPEEF